MSAKPAACAAIGVVNITKDKNIFFIVCRGLKNNYLKKYHIKILFDTNLLQIV